MKISHANKKFCYWLNILLVENRHGPFDRGTLKAPVLTRLFNTSIGDHLVTAVNISSLRPVYQAKLNLVNNDSRKTRTNTITVILPRRKADSF